MVNLLAISLMNHPSLKRIGSSLVPKNPLVNLIGSALVLVFLGIIPLVVLGTRHECLL